MIAAEEGWKDVSVENGTLERSLVDAMCFPQMVLPIILFVKDLVADMTCDAGAGLVNEHVVPLAVVEAETGSRHFTEKSFRRACLESGRNGHFGETSKMHRKY